MKAVIMQPTYLPWMGYFDLMDQSDVFVFLDNVKLEKSYWDMRNRIKDAHGGMWLSIPVQAVKGRLHTLINEAIIDDKQNWRKSHLKSMYYSYKKSKHFNEVYFLLEKLLNNSISNLAEFNIEIIKGIAGKIGINTKYAISSEIEGIEGDKDMRLVNICRRMNCDKYISPKGSAVYIEKIEAGGEFPKHAIDLYYQDYEHPVYKQLYKDFLPFMSIIDLLFNCGFDNSLEIIRTGRRMPIDFKSFREKYINDL